MTPVQFVVKFTEPKESTLNLSFDAFNKALEKTIIEFPYAVEKSYDLDFLKCIPKEILIGDSLVNGHNFEYLLGLICEPIATIESIIMTQKFLKITIKVSLTSNFAKTI